MKPLDGIVVLDMTRVLAGPYCTMLLSDLGARVIKVERPGIGDDSRHFGPFKNDRSAYFLSINREKESITVDLKKEEGKEIIRKFVKKADILVENFRPGTMEKLGLGYETLKEINPKLIYAASSGFGHSGPWSTKPAYDMIVQAAGGMMSITGWPDGKPTRVGASIGDITAALFTCIGVNSALYQRTITGLGQKIDVAMLDCQLAILENALVRYAIDNRSPTPLGARHPTITPFEAFETSDSWIVIAVGNDKIWKVFCKAIGDKELSGNPKYETNKLRCDNYDEVSNIIAKLLKQKTTKEWKKIFDEVTVPCTPISKIEDLVENPQLKARNMFMNVEDEKIGEIKIAGNPIKMTSIDDKDSAKNAPLLGEHNNSVLEELLGYSKEEVEKLKEKSVI